MIFYNNSAMLVDEGLRQLSRDKAAQLLFGSRALYKNTPSVDDEPVIPSLRLEVRGVIFLLGAVNKTAISRNCFSPNQRKQAARRTAPHLRLEPVPHERSGRDAIAPIRKPSRHAFGCLDQANMTRLSRRKPGRTRIVWQPDFTILGQTGFAFVINVEIMDLETCPLATFKIKSK